MGLSTSDRGEVRWEAPFCRQYHWTGLIRQKVLGVSRGATIIPLHQFWCSMGVSRVHTEVWLVATIPLPPPTQHSKSRTSI